MPETFASFFTSSGAFDPFTLHTMFDCPEHSQTSPTSTSLNSSQSFLDLTVRTCAVLLLFPTGICTDHVPSLLMVSDQTRADGVKVTCTVSPGNPVPPIQLKAFCCNTIESPMSGLTRSSTSCVAPKALIAVHSPIESPVISMCHLHKTSSRDDTSQRSIHSPTSLPMVKKQLAQPVGLRQRKSMSEL